MKEFDDFMEVKKDLSKHTLRSYESAITKLLQYYNISDIAEFKKLTMLDIEKYLASLEIEASSYNAYLRNIKVFTSWLRGHSITTDDIAIKIKSKKEIAKKKISLTEDERKKMIQSATSLDLKLSLSLMLYMGLRRDELVRLKVSDISGNYLTVLGKGNKKVELEMPPVVKMLVDNYLKIRNTDSEYLIVSKVGKHQIVNTGSIFKRVKHIAEKAGIAPERVAKIAPHTLRRTFACLAVQNNVSPYIVKDMLRHKNFKTTEKYLAAMGSEVANSAIRNQPMPEMEALQWKTL